MIIDQIVLAGSAAYLKRDDVDEDDPEVLNLAQGTRIGSSATPGEGLVQEINGLNLQIERDDVMELFARQAEPLIAVEVWKEMFPGLFKDPYAHRVHRVAGFEDFGRGTLENLRVMEVDGVPALVSLGAGEPSRWLSPIYQMPGPLNFDAVAWDIPSAKTTTPDAFTYGLRLYVWREGEDLGAAPTSVGVVKGAPPRRNRFRDNLQSKLADVIAYQVEFTATVKADAFLNERHSGTAGGESLGRPLLTGVHLLEMVSSAHNYHSLQEMIEDSSDYSLFDLGNDPPRRLTCALNLTATLTVGERIVLKVPRADPKLKRLEARLDANVLLRPPRIDKRG